VAQKIYWRAVAWIFIVIVDALATGYFVFIQVYVVSLSAFIQNFGVLAYTNLSASWRLTLGTTIILGCAVGSVSYSVVIERTGYPWSMILANVVLAHIPISFFAANLHVLAVGLS
jgi:hypothetical protein